MDLPPDIDRRLMDLEVKAAYTEDLIESLNQVVIRQQQQIDRLLKELAQLREAQPDPAATPFRSLRDELPPHY